MLRGTDTLMFIVWAGDATDSCVCHLGAGDKRLRLVVEWGRGKDFLSAAVLGVMHD